MMHKSFTRTFCLMALLACIGQTASATIVRMDFSLGDQSTGEVYVELFDAEAPVTVANFLSYVDDGAGSRRYDGTFLHRSYSQNIDIIQGGGFRYDPTLGPFGPATAPHINVDANNDGVDDTIINEYDPLRPNARGTLAMARLSALDSATSEWFFNLIDDSALLPNYAVFGRVLGNGMDVLDAINALPVENLGGAFGTLPTVNHTPATPVTQAHLVTLDRVVSNPPARISIDRTRIDFGLVAPGTTPPTQTITIQNIGSTDLAIGNIATLDPLGSPFSISSDGCSGITLASLGSCQIDLQFQPTAFGAVQDSFDIPSSDGSSPAIGITVDGFGAQSSPTLDSIPANTINFGNVALADNAVQQVTIRNVGTGNLSLSATFGTSGPDSGDFSVTDIDCANAVLALSDSCTIEVRFTGTSLGDRTGNDFLTISAQTGTGTQTLQLALVGSVVPSQADLVMPVSTDGSNLVNFGDTRFDIPLSGGIRFFNRGTGDLIFSAIRFTGPDAAEFSISTSNCTRVLPQQECIETVIFTPTGTGTRSATLEVATNDPDTPLATLTFTATSSTDNDGVPDAIEAAAPNGGDGNADGIADVEQEYVASLPDNTGAYVTLVADASRRLTRVRTLDNPSPANSPQVDGGSLSFPRGFFAFTLENVPRGGAATVTLILPEGTSPNAYFKYNALQGAWYSFEYLEASNTGAVFDGNRVTLHFVDGGRGDHETGQNGRIVDPGGPALLSASSSSSGGGGGCSMVRENDRPVPASLLLFAAILAMLRRRKPRPVDSG